MGFIRLTQSNGWTTFLNMVKRTTTITGACGEHYIAAYLSSFGLVVAMLHGGIEGCDLFVAKSKDSHAVGMQVKTGTQSKRNNREEGEIYLWPTPWNAIDRDDKNLWYAYVWLNNWPESENQPEVFFIPSNVVARRMKQSSKEGYTRPFFWMRADDAKTFRGHSGLKLLLEALGS
jgi:hypothetical protein